MGWTPDAIRWSIYLLAILGWLMIGWLIAGGVVIALAPALPDSIGGVLLLVAVVAALAIAIVGSRRTILWLRDRLPF